MILMKRPWNWMSGNAFTTVIRQKYYLLANDFIKLGQELYQKKDYCSVFRGI